MTFLVVQIPYASVPALVKSSSPPSPPLPLSLIPFLKSWGSCTGLYAETKSDSDKDKRDSQALKRTPSLPSHPGIGPREKTENSVVHAFKERETFPINMGRNEGHGLWPIK